MTSKHQNYTIGAGITEDELSKWLEQAAEKFGVFDDGRVNYTHADIAPIILCIIACEDEFLLVKRGYGLADAEGYWSVITGFIDEIKPVKEQIIQEVKEETGLAINAKDIKLGQSYTLHNPQEKRRYIIFPACIRLSSKAAISLNDEHTDKQWITQADLKKFHILEDLPYAISRALNA